MSENTESIAAQGNEMGTLPVGRLLRKMSVPLIFSMFVQVLYGLVDSMYVARLGDAALTAISLSMPVQYLVLGVGIGIGVGVNSVLSQKLGEQDAEGVDRAAGNGFILVWIMSVLFVFLGAFAMEPFYRMQTDIAEVLDMSIAYSKVISIVSFAALHQVLILMKSSTAWRGHSTRPSLPAGTARKASGHLSGRGPSILLTQDRSVA